MLRAEGLFLRSGKVRDLYDLGDGRLVLVASDRISAFDVVLPTPIPDKGRVLTGLSRFWFAETADVVRNHLLDTDPAVLPAELVDDPGVVAELRGRTMIGRRVDVLPVECVVRGYLAGSAWKAYVATGEICGIELPPGLRECERLPEPIFTPAWKAPAGVHDENIPFAHVIPLVGHDLALRIRAASFALYRRGAAICRRAGIILADTKFEFGVDPASGELLLVDEVLTPDSSRFWDAATLRAGPAPGELRQAVRSRLARGPAVGQVPAGTRAAGRRRRRHAGSLRGSVRADHRRLVRPVPGGGSRRPMSTPGAGPAATFRFAVNVTPKEGILDPQGRAVEQSLPHLGVSGVGNVRVGRRVELTVEAADEAAARAVVERLAGELLSNPLIEQYAIEYLTGTLFWSEDGSP